MTRNLSAVGSKRSINPTFLSTAGATPARHESLSYREILRRHHRKPGRPRSKPWRRQPSSIAVAIAVADRDPDAAADPTQRRRDPHQSPADDSAAPISRLRHLSDARAFRPPRAALRVRLPGVVSWRRPRPHAKSEQGPLRQSRDVFRPAESPVPPASGQTPPPVLITQPVIGDRYYSVQVAGLEIYNGRPVFHLTMHALTDEVQHPLKDLWVDVVTFEVWKAHVMAHGAKGAMTGSIDAVSEFEPASGY